MLYGVSGAQKLAVVIVTEVEDDLRVVLVLLSCTIWYSGGFWRWLLPIAVFLWLSFHHSAFIFAISLAFALATLLASFLAFISSFFLASLSALSFVSCSACSLVSLSTSSTSSSKASLSAFSWASMSAFSLDNLERILKIKIKVKFPFRLDWIEPNAPSVLYSIGVYLLVIFGTVYHQIF